MKKGFTLVELMISIAITSIILLMIYNIADFSSSILAKHKYQEEFIDEVVLVENMVRKYIEESVDVQIIDNKLVNQDSHILSFDANTSRLYINGEHIITTSVIENIVFSKDNRLITVVIRISDKEYFTFNYFK